MGQLGPFQILIIIALIVLLFGRGKISALMGDVAQGIKAFRRGMRDEEKDTARLAREQEESAPSVKAEKNEKA